MNTKKTVKKSRFLYIRELNLKRGSRREPFMMLITSLMRLGSINKFEDERERERERERKIKCDCSLTCECVNIDQKFLKFANTSRLK